MPWRRSPSACRSTGPRLPRTPGQLAAQAREARRRSSAGPRSLPSGLRGVGGAPSRCGGPPRSGEACPVERREVPWDLRLACILHDLERPGSRRPRNTTGNFSDCPVRQTTRPTETRIPRRAATAVRQLRAATDLRAAGKPCRNQHRAPPRSNRRGSTQRRPRKRSRLARNAVAVRGRRVPTGPTQQPPGSRLTPPTARPMRRLAGGFWPSTGRSARTASESSSRRR